MVVSRFFSIRNFKNGTERTVIGGNIQWSNDVTNTPSNKGHQMGRGESGCEGPQTIGESGYGKGLLEFNVRNFKVVGVW